MTGQE